MSGNCGRKGAVCEHSFKSRLFDFVPWSGIPWSRIPWSLPASCGVSTGDPADGLWLSDPVERWESSLHTDVLQVFGRVGAAVELAGSGGRM